MWLVDTILDFLFPLNRQEAQVAQASTETLGVFVHPIPVNEDVVALMPYRKPLVRACVVEAKFRGNERAEDLLARVLADYLNEWSAEYAAFNLESVVLVPVPLSPQRLAQRGYNQTERVARKATKRLPDVYLDTDILIRSRDTSPQTSLTAHQRRENLTGAFRVQGAPDLTYTYIVFDDVVTTGSTLSAAISALRNAGAGQVLGIALAH